MLFFNGTSFFKVTNSMFLSRSLIESLNDSPTAPFSSLDLFIRFSRLRYSVSHFDAVLGPTFGTPGILSEESPTKAKYSIICSGPTPNFSLTFLESKVSSVMVFIINTFSSSTNCIKSLSNDEIMTVCLPFSSEANVAITSSASTPEISTTGAPM